MVMASIPFLADLLVPQEQVALARGFAPFLPALRWGRDPSFALPSSIPFLIRPLGSWIIYIMHRFPAFLSPTLRSILTQQRFGLPEPLVAQSLAMLERRQQVELLGLLPKRAQ